MTEMAVRDTPLCPAGHLPLKGGDQARRPSACAQKFSASMTRLISPLEGEMPGRAEGGDMAVTLPN